MTAQFTITRLVGHRAIITGQDQFGTEGRILVDTRQWDEVLRLTARDQATQEFDQAVEQFFAPLTEAVEAFEQAQQRRAEDDLTTVVVREPVEGAHAQPGLKITLNPDSLLLRLVEAGNFDRLVWVHDDVLEVLALDEPVADSEPVADGAGQDSDDQ